MFRYDLTQNASPVRAGEAIAAGSLVGITNGKVFADDYAGAPIGVAQTAAEEGDIVEYATGQVAVRLTGTDPATIGAIVYQSDSYGASVSDVDARYRVGIALTAGAPGARIVVQWSVEPIEEV